MLLKLLNNIKPIFNVSSRQLLGYSSVDIVQPTGNIAGGMWSTIIARTNIRNHFPVPKETKRIRVHGWKKRMSTPEGRRVIMRRILKGRHVLSH